MIHLNSNDQSCVMKNILLRIILDVDCEMNYSYNCSRAIANECEYPSNLCSCPKTCSRLLDVPCEAIRCR